MLCTTRIRIAFPQTGARIDVEGLVACKPDESEAESARCCNGKAARSRNADDRTATRDDGFLNYLEAGPTADVEPEPGRRQRAEVAESLDLGVLEVGLVRLPEDAALLARQCVLGLAVERPVPAPGVDAHHPHAAFVQVGGVGPAQVGVGAVERVLVAVVVEGDGRGPGNGRSTGSARPGGRDHSDRCRPSLGLGGPSVDGEPEQLGQLADQDREGEREGASQDVADSFHDSMHAAVTNAETFAGHAADVRLTAGRTIQRDVADDDVLVGLERRAGRRIQDQLAARQALAEIVVGVSFQIERHATRQERAEALARRALEPNLDLVLGQAGGAVLASDLAAGDGADDAIDVADRQLGHDLFAALDRGLADLQQLGHIE